MAQISPHRPQIYDICCQIRGKTALNQKNMEGYSGGGDKGAKRDKITCWPSYDIHEASEMKESEAVKLRSFFIHWAASGYPP